MKLIYNLETQAEQAFDYLSKLSGKHARVEIKEKKPQRSGQQNRFYWLLVSYFGLQIGYTPDEAHIYVKRHMSDVFLYEKTSKTGETIKFMRSSSDLDNAEMTKVLDRLYRLAADMGVSLPLVDNEDTRALMANEIEQNKY